MELDLVVVGMGYVGLPLALEACRAGMAVAGLDHSPSVIQNLSAGCSHIDDVSDLDIQEMNIGGFVATGDESILRRSKAAVICVPTPLSPDGGPDLGAVMSATSAIARHLHRGQLIVLESTTHPGTTDEKIKPLLEATGFRCGSDFYLAFSPERVDPGNPHYGVRNTPKVVGGCDPASTTAAVGLYSRFIDEIISVPSTREAEMAKLLENTYRHINIALVNEMARFCHDMDIDLWEVIRAAATKPFGFQPFYPGPGVGGHCIPIDPNYLSHTVQAKLGYPFRFVELAQEINLSMPNYIANRAQQILNRDGMAVKGCRILLLGVTYKPNISDQRESPAAPLAKALKQMGAHISYSDPEVERWSANGTGVPRELAPESRASNYDLVILLQDHDSFDLVSIAEGSVRLFDTRGRVPESRVVERL